MRNAAGKPGAGKTVNVEWRRQITQAAISDAAQTKRRSAKLANVAVSPGANRTERMWPGV